MLGWSGESEIGTERCRPGARGPLHGFLFICTRAPLSLVPGHPRRWWPLLHTNRQKNRLVELSGEVLRGVPWTGPSCCSAGVRGDISVLLSEELDGVSRLASTEKSVMLQQQEGTPHAAEGPRPLRTPAPAPRISCWLWVTARCWLVGEGGSRLKPRSCILAMTDSQGRKPAFVLLPRFLFFHTQRIETVKGRCLLS